jgi:hypothetical protein
MSITSPVNLCFYILDASVDVEQPEEQPVCRRRRMERPGVGISSEDDADGEYEEDDDEVEVQDLDDVIIFLPFYLQN